MLECWAEGHPSRVVFVCLLRGAATIAFSHNQELQATQFLSSARGFMSPEARWAREYPQDPQDPQDTQNPHENGLEARASITF